MLIEERGGRAARAMIDLGDVAPGNMSASHSAFAYAPSLEWERRFGWSTRLGDVRARESTG